MISAYCFFFLLQTQNKLTKMLKREKMTKLKMYASEKGANKVQAVYIYMYIYIYMEQFRISWILTKTWNFGTKSKIIISHDKVNSKETNDFSLTLFFFPEMIFDYYLSIRIQVTHLKAITAKVKAFLVCATNSTHHSGSKGKSNRALLRGLLFGFWTESWRNTCPSAWKCFKEDSLKHSHVWRNNGDITEQSFFWEVSHWSL